MPDLVGAAKQSESLCENCMNILRLLSEEVFDFSRGELTQAKITELKNALNTDFPHHPRAVRVRAARTRRKPELDAADAADAARVPELDPARVHLREHAAGHAAAAVARARSSGTSRFSAWAEIGGLAVEPKYDQHFVKLYVSVITQLQQILPRSVKIAEAYANGSDEEQAYIQNLAIFLTQFFKQHITLLEKTQEHQQLLLVGLEYLLNISYTDEPEVFKVCLDYWHVLVCDLYQSDGDGVNAGSGLAEFSFAPASAGGGAGGSTRRMLYSSSMSQLRMLMVSRMAKPEEVLIVEDENGNIVRETLKDNDVLVQYKIMRETLIYLAHLDHKDTETQMLEKLSNQLNGKEYSWNVLNTLCWAIGSISGSMAEDQENRFLVTAIRDLLNLCEITRGKDHKAVIASNIMYVVGQYPRFLRLHWKFLKTVVNKLFEFMHETHPGVQDMACDTFLKIAIKCKRKFVIMQVGEHEPFVDELLRSIGTTIRDLEPHQIHTFYEAVGHMISSEVNPAKREELVQRLMDPPNTTWNQIMAQAKTQGGECLKPQEVIKNLGNILKTNTSACTSLRAAVPEPDEHHLRGRAQRVPVCTRSSSAPPSRRAVRTRRRRRW